MSTAIFGSDVEPTIENLKAAYQGEMTARARYLAFAKQADAEGFSGVASLFRAAARAEQIHAHNQARVLRQMGAEAPTVTISIQVQDTLSNLLAALAGENHEVNTMYPAFIEAAHTSINTTAARCFEWSLEAEKGHARLCNEALTLCSQNRLDSWISTARSFFVCPVCAGTTEEKAAENCVICQYPAERAEAIA